MIIKKSSWVLCIRIPINKTDAINKISFIFFLNNFFLNIRKKADKPITKKIELCIKPCDTKKFVMYDRIVISRIPLKPNSPSESLSDKSLEDIYPKPIIENKIIK